MKIYVGRDAFRTAALIVACYGNDNCARIAKFEIKARAETVKSKTAADLMFWCGVLASSQMFLATGEAARLIDEATESDLEKINQLYQQSREVTERVEMF